MAYSHSQFRRHYHNDKKQCCLKKRCSDVEKTRTTTTSVEVKAPATLHEGFEFWIDVGALSFPIKVPPGGVRCGQTLQVQLAFNNNKSNNVLLDVEEEANLNNMQQPLLTNDSMKFNIVSINDNDRKDDGNNNKKWKDGLCSCFRFGLFHPSLCNAWLCPQILLGQILTRMKMTWLAQTSNKKSNFKSTFNTILACLILFSIYDAFMAPPMFELNVNDNGEIIMTTPTTSNDNDNGTFFMSSLFVSPIWHQVAYLLCSLPMSIYGFIVVVKLRSAIRNKYGISTGCLGRLEDTCCVCCCNCCVLAQMARQTADYEHDEPAACCTSNGLSSTTTTAKIIKGNNNNDSMDNKKQQLLESTVTVVSVSTVDTVPLGCGKE